MQLDAKITCTNDVILCAVLELEGQEDSVVMSTLSAQDQKAQQSLPGPEALGTCREFKRVPTTQEAAVVGCPRQQST